MLKEKFVSSLQVEDKLVIVGANFIHTWFDEISPTRGQTPLT